MSLIADTKTSWYSRANNLIFPMLFGQLLLAEFRLAPCDGLVVAGLWGLLLKKLFVYRAPNTMAEPTHCIQLRGCTNQTQDRSILTNCRVVIMVANVRAPNVRMV
uniref:Uncharacterized protein n=1 Tax=Arundo donax TaxID=35708 RepID=A0A0A9EFX5_ARUDO